MATESSARDPAVGLASGPVAPVGAGQGESSVALPRFSPLGERFSLRVPRVALHPLAGPIALATLILGALVVVAFSTAGPNVLVPRSYNSFPGWEAGPMHLLSAVLPTGHSSFQIGFSVVLVLMTVAYGIVLASVRTFSMRTIVLVVLALHLILLMSPPISLTDLFNYLGYARLGGLHHLNPYTHVIDDELRDPIFRFTTWHHLSSPYGPLFTALSYPVAWLPLAWGYWTIKIVTVLASLTFIWLVWKCAVLLGRDPRFAVLFVAANPVFLMFEIAGFHNDFFMLIPSTAAIALLLSRHDRSAGAMLMVAVAVKFTAVLLLPFLLLAARPGQRRKEVLIGAALATVPLAVMYLALFGLSLPNLADQSTLLTPWAIPNMVGLILGLGGGAPGLLRVANVALVVTVALLLRRRRDWLVGAGWSTFALIVSLAWLVPWYVVWLLPLAALASSYKLRRVAVVFTVYLVIGFIPETGTILSKFGINLMNSSAGQASMALQHKLEQ